MSNSGEFSHGLLVNLRDAQLFAIGLVLLPIFIFDVLKHDYAHRPWIRIRGEGLWCGMCQSYLSIETLPLSHKLRCFRRAAKFFRYRPRNWVRY